MNLRKNAGKLLVIAMLLVAVAIIGGVVSYTNQPLRLGPWPPSPPPVAPTSTPQSSDDPGSVRDYEAEYKSSIVDTDGDGLGFANEKYYCTDPNNVDTDGDGYLDGDEVVNSYNPNGSGTLDYLGSERNHCPNWNEQYGFMPEDPILPKLVTNNPIPKEAFLPENPISPELARSRILIPDRQPFEWFNNLPAETLNDFVVSYIVFHKLYENNIPETKEEYYIYKKCADSIIKEAFNNLPDDMRLNAPGTLWKNDEDRWKEISLLFEEGVATWLNEPDYKSWTFYQAVTVVGIEDLEPSKEACSNFDIPNKYK